MAGLGLMLLLFFFKVKKLIYVTIFISRQSKKFSAKVLNHFDITVNICRIERLGFQFFYEKKFELTIVGSRVVNF
jgi:hypothetical protein